MVVVGGLGVGRSRIPVRASLSWLRDSEMQALTLAYGVRTLHVMKSCHPHCNPLGLVPIAPFQI